VFGAEHPAGSILQSHRVKRAAHQRPYRKKFETKVAAFPQCYFYPWCGVHEILVRIRIRGSMPLNNESGSCHFVIDLQDANKKLIFCKSFSAHYFLKVHLHNLTKIKSQKEITKQVGIKVFLTFSLADKRIRIREAQKQTDPTDPDPQHWFLLLLLSLSIKLKISGQKSLFQNLFFREILKCSFFVFQVVPMPRKTTPWTPPPSRAAIRRALPLSFSAL
jgi:hypothetical protein